jgi:hypothetical protein
VRFDKLRNNSKVHLLWRKGNLYFPRFIALWSHNWRINILLTWWGNIVWLIEQTLLCASFILSTHMVTNLEELLQSLYSYFSNSFKWHLKFSKLAKIMKTKGLKILRNVNMQWMSMLEPLKCALIDYKILILILS